jgi:hypothetical protein
MAADCDTKHYLIVAKVEINSAWEMIRETIQYSSQSESWLL